MSANERVEVHPLSLPLLVFIVNEWGALPRSESHEEADPYPDPERLGGEPTGFRVGRPGSGTGVPLERELIETADLLHPVFSSGSGAECAKRLDDLRSRSKLTSSLEAEDWQIREEWHTAGPDSALLAAATLTLLDHLRRHPDASRLGTCRGTECADVYVDQSPAGRRRYCSLICQNRARTRAYRARRKGRTGAGGRR